MILKGSQRAGGKALAIHLLRTDENDHVHVHQIRGFTRDNVMDALNEAYAVSRGTKCKQFLFSLSLSPPAKERVPVEAFDRAIDKIELRLGLTGQPRCIVFHEKDGRRHAHCVWSRIDAATMTAKQMGHFKLKLGELSRELYLEHGWSMPAGLAKIEPPAPLNFTLAEWQQAKRIDRDPARIKEIFKECWALADSGRAFRQALESHGYHLARGDRRGFVAVDWTGEIYSISRWCSVPTKQVNELLERFSTLAAVDQVKAKVTTNLAEELQTSSGALTIQFEEAQAALRQKRDKLVRDQRAERQLMESKIAQRWKREEIERASRFRRGLMGIWDWLTGHRAKVIALHEQEIVLARRRDAAERQMVIDEQMAVRRRLQTEILSIKTKKESLMARLQGMAGPTFSNIPTLIVPVRQRRSQKPSLER